MASLEGVSLDEMEQLATLSKTLADNPSTRKEFLKLIKTASPSTSIPEIDMEFRMNEQNKPLFDKIESLERQANEASFKQQRKDAHEKLYNMGITESEIPEVEKTMLDKKIGDFETAGEYYLGQKKIATPTANTFKTAMTMPDIKEMGGDAAGWARGQAFEAINDIIRSRR